MVGMYELTFLGAREWTDKEGGAHNSASLALGDRMVQLDLGGMATPERFDRLLVYGDLISLKDKTFFGTRELTPIIVYPTAGLEALALTAASVGAEVGGPNG